MELQLIVFGLMLLMVNGDEDITTTTTISSPASTATANSSNTTPQPSTTTQQTPLTTPNNTKSPDNTSKVEASPSKRTQFFNSTSFACGCDITLNCDFNCCCDFDCSEEIIKAFICEDGLEIEDFNREGLNRCELENSWLCVMDSSGSQDIKLPAPFHLDYNSYKWKMPSVDLEPRPETFRDFYKYGDEIIAFDTKNDLLDTFKIPIAFTDSFCFSDSIKFLKSQSSTCLTSLSELCNENKNLIIQLMGLQVFRKPPKVTEMRDSADLLSIKIKRCVKSLANCTEVTMNDSEELELLSDELFDEVHLDFLINGTSISSASATFLSQSNLACGTEELGLRKFVQRIDVRFKIANETAMRRIRKFSRGYKDEEAIIVSKLRYLNETNPDEGSFLEYFHIEESYEDEFHLKLPDSRRGMCILDDFAFDLVHMNEHSLSKCKVSLLFDEDNSAVEKCEQFKRQILYHLFSMMNVTSNYTQSDYTSRVYVSKFWSPRYDLTSWVPIETLNIPPISKDVRESDESLVCSNIVTSVSYSIFTSHIRSTKSRKFENEITKIVIEFAPSREINFVMENGNQTSQIDIHVQVQFFRKLN